MDALEEGNTSGQEGDIPDPRSNQDAPPTRQDSAYAQKITKQIQLSFNKVNHL